MKSHLQALLGDALSALVDAGELPTEALVEAPVERSRGGDHGDFASPVAMGLARVARRSPRQIAEAIIARLPASERVSRVEIAGPGFINFHVAEASIQSVVGDILAAGERFGHSALGNGERIQVEFVSANPTGPLHVGHGRNAAYGAVVSNLLAATGHEVQREYYLNDAGRQMDILATSVWLRYLQARGETVPFPANGYRGEYIRDIAAMLATGHGDRLERAASEVTDGLPPDVAEGGDKEVYIDALIGRARTMLGDEDYGAVRSLAVATMVDDIRTDLEAFGVTFDRWYSEASLYQGDAIPSATKLLESEGHAYVKDGALWFRSSEFGDEKDRVVVRENGQPTYFASDIAYHKEKFERGFERVIDVWGADHHGYLPRVKGALAAMGKDPDCFEVLFVQFANLFRGGQMVQMSTRSGEFVTLKELREEVGNDAARFFYVMRRCEQHLDFDLDLARSQSNDNPVYYVQYAHARVCSVMRQAEERGLGFDAGVAVGGLDALVEPHERTLIKSLARLPEVVRAAALAREPHQVAFYVREVANDFHTYYNAHTFLVPEERLRQARLALCAATRQVLVNGLALLGVGAPESM